MPTFSHHRPSNWCPIFQCQPSSLHTMTQDHSAIYGSPVPALVPVVHPAAQGRRRRQAEEVIDVLPLLREWIMGEIHGEFPPGKPQLVKRKFEAWHFLESTSTIQVSIQRDFWPSTLAETLQYFGRILLLYRLGACCTYDIVSVGFLHIRMYVCKYVCM